MVGRRYETPSFERRSSETVAVDWASNSPYDRLAERASSALTSPEATTTPVLCL